MKNLLLISLLTCAIIQFSYGQQTSLRLLQVNEKRNTGEAKNIMNIILAVDSLRLNTEHLIQVKDSLLIIDNTGASLEVYKNYPYGGYYQKGKELSIGFQAPRREATTIEKIAGVLEYFTISEELNSKIVLSNFINQTNQNLLRESSGPKIILVDHIVLKKLYKTSEYYPEITRLHKKAGIGRTLEEADLFSIICFIFKMTIPSWSLIFI